MRTDFRKILERHPVETSAPCRIDMGGTLDISTFYCPLKHLEPCTVNMAIDLRTRVRLTPCEEGVVRVSSRGFKTAQFPIDKAPFDHPLGMMFAIAAYFRAEGVHIDIESQSPVRSALGGSSAAAVALVAAFSQVAGRLPAEDLPGRKVAWIAHMLEASVAGVPCGFQDQLAAVYGGVNLWSWKSGEPQTNFKRKVLIPKKSLKNFQRHLIVAYCGVPHESRDVNSRWVKQFISGKHRGLWAEIVACTRKFARALVERNIGDACDSMNRETAIRRRMTPEVLDDLGAALVESAVTNRCGARFTGAGGGGCLWAFGASEDIDKLRGTWEVVLSTRRGAALLDAKIDAEGLLRTPRF